MRTLKIIFVTVFICSFCTPLWADKKAEEEKIIDLILKNSKSYHSLDFESYKETWVHKPYVMRMDPDGGRVTNWDTLAQRYQNAMENEIPLWDDIRISISNFHADIKGKTAWVVNDQQEVGLSEGGPDLYKVWAIRFLEKVDGEWKLAFYITGDYPDPKDPPIQGNLNETANLALQAGQFEKAIEIYELNAKLYPDSWEVYDSLGEVYLKTGKKKQAIETFKRSLVLNPENNNVITKLKMLE